MVDGGSIFSMMPPMLIRFPTAVAESLSPTYQYIYIFKKGSVRFPVLPGWFRVVVGLEVLAWVSVWVLGFFQVVEILVQVPECPCDPRGGSEVLAWVPAWVLVWNWSNQLAVARVET